MENVIDLTVLPVHKVVKSHRAQPYGTHGAQVTLYGAHEGPPGSGVRNPGTEKTCLFLEVTLEELIRDGLNIYVRLDPDVHTGRLRFVEQGVSKEFPDKLKVDVEVPQFGKRPAGRLLGDISKVDFALKAGGVPKDYDRRGVNEIYAHIDDPSMRFHTGFDFEDVWKLEFEDLVEPPQVFFVYHMSFSVVPPKHTTLRQTAVTPQVIRSMVGEGEVYCWPNSFDVCIYNDMIGHLVISVCILEVNGDRRVPVLYQMIEIDRPLVVAMKPEQPDELANSRLQEHHVTLQKVVVTPESTALLESRKGTVWPWSREDLEEFLNPIPEAHRPEAGGTWREVDIQS